MQPLLSNTGLGVGVTVDLRFTNVGCADVAALEAKGVVVREGQFGSTGIVEPNCL